VQTLRTRVRQVSPEAPAPAAVAEAAAVLAGKGLVGFPTESYYGLGADAREASAVRRVFEVKGRPDSKPLLLLVDSLAMLESLVETLPSQARALMERHWPGPLTVVLRARPTVPSAVTAGTGTVGVRIPGHPVALALVRALGAPVTAPSANPSGAPPPTTAQDVVDRFEGKIELVLDAGRTAGGPPSTVVDATVVPPTILRAGAVTL
jgi:L-threonylcarbamoyladenylate synthase